MANEAVVTYSATTTTAVTTTATVADGEVVGGQNELDNSSEWYPLALAVINVADTFGGTPDGSIDIYMVRGEVDVNDGTPADDGTALGYAALTTTDNQTDAEYAEYLGSFNPDVDEAYRDARVISIHGVRKAKFYIQNNTGQTMVYSSNAITLHVTPFTYEPGA